MPGRARYDFGSRGLQGSFRGWGYQDFTAGSITTTAVTISANENGTDLYGLDTAKIVDSTAIVVRKDYPAKKAYTGTTVLFSSKVAASAHTGTSVPLSGVPHTTWGDIRVYYFYDYPLGIPQNYQMPSKAVAENLFAELQDLMITEEELGDGSKDAVFNTLENTPIGATTASTGIFSDLTCDGLTLYLTQDYLLTDIASLFAVGIQGQTAAKPGIIALFSADGDATDGSYLRTFAKGTPDSLTVHESLVVGYSGAAGYIITSTKGGDGSLHYPIVIDATGNATQLVLGTDGDCTMAGGLAVSGDLAVDALSTSGALFVGSTSEFDGSSNQFNGDVDILGDLDVTGVVSADSITTDGTTANSFSSDLTVTGTMTVDGALSVTGSVNIAGDLSFTGSAINLLNGDTVGITSGPILTFNTSPNRVSLVGNFSTTGNMSCTGIISGPASVDSLVFSAGSGTAVVPSIAFTGDTNTGIWRSAVDTINISTAGVERLEIDSAEATFAIPIGDGTYSASVEEILTASINFIIDGGGSAITTGEKGHIEIPFACTIKQVTLLADQSGAIKIDIWKDIYANFPPDNTDTITGANEPEIAASGVKDQDSTLTSWTTSISAGDILAFNVDSITTVKRCTVSLKVIKT